MNFLNPYIHSKKLPNTFIGGVGATITSRAQLAAKLTGIVESDIKKFNVDANNNVSCYIGKDFNLSNRAFEDDTDITFFYNTDGRHKNVDDYIFAGCTNFRFYSNYGVGSASPWATAYGMFEFSKVSHVFLENATVLRGYRTFGNINNTRIYIPNIISTNGVVSGANNPFADSSGLILYMNENYDSDSTLNARVNGGLSAGNIAQVIKITDFTTPDSVNDLSVSDYGATYIKLDFTPIAEADFYEVWIKKSGSDVWELFGDLPDSKFLTGLEKNTTYQIKLATCDEFWNGSGFFSDPNKRAFSNTITQTTGSNTYSETYTDEYEAMLDYAIANNIEIPKVTQRVIDDALITQLKVDGIFSDFVAFYFAKSDYPPLPASHNFYTLNWKNPGSFTLYNPTEALRPDFVPNKGWISGNRGSGNHYFLTGVMPSSHLTQMDCAVFFKTFDYTSGGQSIAGARNSNNQGQIYIATPDLLRVFTAVSATGYAGNEDKHTLTYRLGSDARYRVEDNNEVNIGVSGTSALPTSHELAFLGFNNNGTISGAAGGFGISYLGILSATIATTKYQELFDDLDI